MTKRRIFCALVASALVIACFSPASGRQKQLKWEIVIGTDSSDDQPSALYLPKEVMADKRGDIYVLQKESIEKFNSHGGHVLSVASKKNERGPVSLPARHLSHRTETALCMCGTNSKREFRGSIRPGNSSAPSRWARSTNKWQCGERGSSSSSDCHRITYCMSTQGRARNLGVSGIRLNPCPTYLRLRQAPWNGLSKATPYG